MVQGWPLSWVCLGCPHFEMGDSPLVYFRLASWGSLWIRFQQFCCKRPAPPASVFFNGQLPARLCVTRLVLLVRARRTFSRWIKKNLALYLMSLMCNLTLAYDFSLVKISTWNRNQTDLWSVTAKHHPSIYLKWDCEHICECWPCSHQALLCFHTTLAFCH